MTTHNLQHHNAVAVTNKQLSDMTDKQVSYDLSNGVSCTINVSSCLGEGDSCLATSGSSSTLPTSIIYSSHTTTIIIIIIIINNSSFLYIVYILPLHYCAPSVRRITRRSAIAEKESCRQCWLWPKVEDWNLGDNTLRKDTLGLSSTTALIGQQSNQIR